MGVQAMSSRGGGGESLPRQSSAYGHTLNEVQSHIGGPLRSMNLDELLHNVVPSSEWGSTPDGPSGTKTVDEVWRGIQQSASRQPSFAEMTLEDFLSRAGGAATDGNGDGKGNGHVAVAGPSDNVKWLQPQYGGAQQPIADVGASITLNAAFHDEQASAMAPLTGRLPEGGPPGRKRAVAADGLSEKTVERKQKRKIKNRESAARSRARKQAYTNELENKILRLEEENERLRKEKELEPILPDVIPPDPQNRLRRTNSAPS